MAGALMRDGSDGCRCDGERCVPCANQATATARATRSAAPPTVRYPASPDSKTTEWMSTR